MNKKLIVKITFYAFFTGFIFWSIYVDAIDMNPKAIITIGLLIVLMQAYVENRVLLKRLELKYKNQEELINTFSAHCPDLIAYKDRNHNYITCNKVMCELFDLPNSKSIKNKNAFDIHTNKVADIIKKNDGQVIQTGKSVTYALELEHPVAGKKIYDVISAPTTNKGEVIGVVTVARDITIREQLRVKFMEKQRQINEILDNLPMIAFLADTEGNYVRGNKKLLGILNVTHDEMQGVNIVEKYTKEDNETITQENLIAINEKRTYTTERIYNIANNPPRWYREFRVPIFGGKNEIIGTTIFLLDIQHEKENCQQQERFVATLSHDLKTPTIAQIRSLEMLIKGMFGELNDEQLEMLKMTLESCQNMYDMVSTVLFSYKFENKEIKLNYSDVKLTEIAAECCNDLIKEANEKNIEIVIRKKFENDVIRADKSFIKRAISNILENSISYAYENTKIDIIIKEEKDHFVDLEIVTKSPFIKKDVLTTMFDKYLGQTSNYNKIGFCLKFHLARQIVEAHKGAIIAESKETDKNIFGFMVPRTINAHSFANA